MKLTDLEIDHVSASNLTTWINDRGLWFLRYVRKLESSSPAMFRGKAVEHGIVQAMNGEPNPIEIATELYDLDVAQFDFEIDEVDNERILIQKILDASCSDIAKMVDGSTTQKWIDHYIHDVRTYGAIDFENQEKIFELKSMKAMKSEPTLAHLMQCAIYSRAQNKPVTLIYASPCPKDPKKSGHSGLRVFDLSQEQIDFGYRVVEQVTRSLLATIEKCESIDELRDMCAPNIDSFFFNEEIKKIAIGEFYGH